MGSLESTWISKKWGVMKRKNIHKSVIRVGMLWLAGLLLLPSISVAQQYYDPGLIQKTIDRRPVKYQSPGVRLGSFLLNPGAELGWESNDNIFYRENIRISDNIIHIGPWLTLKSDWSRHALNFRAYADIGRYNDFGSEDYDDWGTSLDGRVDVKRGSAFRYTAAYNRLH
jgi:hypothetical protein